MYYLSGWLTQQAMERRNQIGHIFETFVVSEIIKTFENKGREYKNTIFFYSGWDKIKQNNNGEKSEVESEIDLIIDYNNVLYPIEIKKSSIVSQYDARAFEI